MENIICEKLINELLDEKFFVPFYQRGYRWDEQQVRDLLDDFYEFMTIHTDVKEVYCLQPVVVTKIEESGAWEVIDGQQRLTTLYIIMSCLDAFFEAKYSIEYETRPGSQQFLDNIDEDDTSNIDYYHIGKAHKVINEWFSEKINVEKKRSVKMNIAQFILDRVKVIWFEVNETKNINEHVEIFTRINLGKIPLTNAELIKALLLKKADVEDSQLEIERHKQLERASEWDNIEYTLQKGDFWNFINKDISNEPKASMTRIEFIFDCIAPEVKTDDTYATFRYFNDRIQNSKGTTTGISGEQAKIWNDVKKYFMTFEEWYNDAELYHLIGYLVTIGKDDIRQLKESISGKSKSEFKKELKKRVWKCIPEDIDNLSYGKDNESITNTLLLFNIITILNSREESTRFSFEKYKAKKWSLEHIHAQNSEGLNRQEQWRDWIKEHKECLERVDVKKYQELIEEIDIILDDPDKNALTKEVYITVFNKVLQCFKDEFGEDMNLISNLALLDTETNSRLNNSLFDVKRKIIVEMDKKGEYIPFATRNVFLKYYSEDASQIHFWGPKDREDYLVAIKDTFKNYFSDVTEEVGAIV